MRSPIRSPARPARTRRTTTGRTLADLLPGRLPKPTSRLTLNLGLRYETADRPVQQRLPDTVAGDPRALWASPTPRKNDTNNFGPRLGFAYDVRGTAAPWSAAATASTTTRSSRTSRCTSGWTDVRTPLNFLSFSPVAIHARTSTPPTGRRSGNSFIDPTFAGQLLRLTAPDLVQPWAHHFNVGGSAPDHTRRGGGRRLRPFDRQGRDPQVAHQHGAERQHAVLSRRGSSRRSSATIIVEGNRGHSKFDGVYLTGKVRYGRRPGPDQLRLDQGQESGRTTSATVPGGHHERELGARLRTDARTTSGIASRSGGDVAVWRNLSVLEHRSRPTPASRSSALAGGGGSAQRGARDRPGNRADVPAQLVPGGRVPELGHAASAYNFRRQAALVRGAVRGVQHHQPRQLQS